MSRKWVESPDYVGMCRRVSNGNGKLVWTIMVSACGVVFAGFMAWMTSMQGHLSNLDSADSLRRERLSVVEANVNTVSARLIRIEDKLDDLMARFNVKSQ